MANKQYLGDSVYVEECDYGIMLYTADGIETTNKIYLELEVIIALQKYLHDKTP